MDFNLSEEQEMLRKSARNFFAKELPKSLVKQMAEDEKGYPPELWTKMADLGWIGLALPDKYGGSGGDFLNLAILLEEMGRACLPGPFFSDVVLGALTILEAGSEEQKQKLLPKIISGKLIITLAWAEPNAVNSPACFEVEAKAEGDGYIINGTKLFVPNANVVDCIIVAAKTKGGVTLFLVDAKSSGLTVTLLPTMGGDKQCEVKLSGVKVGKGDVLGQVDQGGEVLDKVMARAAIARCAEMVGGAQQVLELSVAYAKERIQYGKPIGILQAVQHHCANMMIDAESCRYITYQAAFMLSQGLPCTKEVAMAKAWVNEAYHRVIQTGHQVHGAIAFQQDHDMHLFIKQQKLGEVTFGGTSYQEEVVAKELGM